MNGEMRWTGEAEFELGGLSFFMNYGNYAVDQGDATRFHILKDHLFFSVYDEIFRSNAIRNMVEIGFFDGGSTLYFLKRYPIEKLVALDIRGNIEALETAIDAHSLRDRLHVGYSVSQADRDAVLSHMAFLNGDPADLIIDDASHDYDLSKACFEICFPLVRPGGFYILEDWSWAHAAATQPGGSLFDHFKDKKALSNLLFEIQALMASLPGLIDNITVYRNCAVIKRGDVPIDAGFSMDGLTRNRGRSFDLI